LDRVGPYAVVEELARGGQGLVLRARGAEGEEVALELLLTGVRASDGQRRRSPARSRRRSRSSPLGGAAAAAGLAWWGARAPVAEAQALLDAFDRLHSLGRAEQAAADAARAERLLDARIARAPGDARAFALRARARRAQDDAGARADVAEALRLDPECAEAYLARSELRWGETGDQGADLAAAPADLDRAIALEPADACLRYERGSALLFQRRDEAAAAALERATELDPAHDMAWERLGSVRVGAGDLAGAEAVFSRLVAVRPDDGEAWAQRGRVRSLRGTWPGRSPTTTPRRRSPPSGC